MNLGKLGQAVTAREIFDLVQEDLRLVEKKISGLAKAAQERREELGLGVY